jgi:hypothetical protein
VSSVSCVRPMSYILCLISYVLRSTFYVLCPMSYVLYSVAFYSHIIYFVTPTPLFTQAGHRPPHHSEA